jgi:hypothetical protein
MCRGNLAAIPTERIYLQLTINVICLYRHPRIHVIETRNHIRCSGVSWSRWSFSKPIRNHFDYRGVTSNSLPQSATIWPYLWAIQATSTIRGSHQDLSRGFWQLRYCDRVFESHSRHWYLSSSICVVPSCGYRSFSPGWSPVWRILLSLEVIHNFTHYSELL